MQTTLALALLLVVAPLTLGQTNVDVDTSSSATLRIRFRYEGPKPALGPLNGSRDPFCANCSIPDERLIVNDQQELANMLLIWDERRNRELPIPTFDEPDEKQVLFKYEGCRFEPHIALARVGQDRDSQRR